MKQTTPRSLRFWWEPIDTARLSNHSAECQHGKCTLHLRICKKAGKTPAECRLL